MIPPFDDRGYLPPGIHFATLDEIASRFGTETEVRRGQTESLGWLVDLAKRAGVERLIVNGSYSTDTPYPNDVDCALLIGDGFPLDSEAEAEIMSGLPFLQIDLVKRADFDFLVGTIYSTDRFMVPKGVLEVAL